MMATDVRDALIERLPLGGVSPSIVDRLDVDPASAGLQLAPGSGSLPEDQAVVDLFLRIGVPYVYILSVTSLTDPADPPFGEDHDLHLHMRGT